MSAQFEFRGICWSCNASHTFHLQENTGRRSLWRKITDIRIASIGICQKCSALSVGCPHCHRAQRMEENVQQCTKCDRRFQSRDIIAPA